VTCEQLLYHYVGRRYRFETKANLKTNCDEEGKLQLMTENHSRIEQVSANKSRQSGALQGFIGDR